MVMICNQAKAANVGAKERRKDEANNLKQRVGLSCAGLSKREETYCFFEEAKNCII